MKNAKDLFDVIVPNEKLNETFMRICSSPQSVAARLMLNDIFQDFEDPDGNFIEQFQTNGFNARFFELYLYAYFTRSGYAVDRSNPNPDFLVTKDGTKVAVEATTLNPSTSGVLSLNAKKISDLNETEVREYLRHELPIRFGSALASKMKKRYWEKPQCADLPFIIAIEAFHDAGSLHFSDTSLVEYAYGIRESASWSPDSELLITTELIDQHTLAEKTIPSGFFAQPEAVNVSAILFTNSGTHAKFSRMGYQSGFGNEVLKIKRAGRAYDLNPDAMDSVVFSYDLDDPPLTEPWGQGLVVLHNPNCRSPLPDRFFSDAQEHHLRGDKIATMSGGWHPFNSTTMLMNVEELRKVLDSIVMGHGPRAVASVPREVFWSMTPSFTIEGEEDGWFADEFHGFLGLVLKNPDVDWTTVVFARNFNFIFVPFLKLGGWKTRVSAVEALQLKIMELLNKPQRLFR